VNRFAAMLVGATALLLCTGASAAGAAEVEGVWSFSGGEVAVRATSAGHYEGIVVSPTRFTICQHPVGEQVWSDIADAGDGTFTGLHQWYFNESDNVASCRPTSRGATTFQIVKPSDGARYLHVCFDPPAELAGQERVCTDSAVIAPLPTTAQSQILSLANGRSCISRRTIRIHLSNPAHDPLTKATIRLQGHDIKVKRGKTWRADIDLRGRAKGAYGVTVTAKTVLGRTIKQYRSFRTCTPKKKRA
jgi:hypothetical protein